MHLSRRSKSFARTAVVSALLVSTAVMAGGASRAAAPPPPNWTPPLVLGAGAEPSIKTLPAGSKDQQAAIVSAPAGTGSNFWYVDENKNADGSFTMKGSAPQQPDLGTGGGDSEISVGRSTPRSPAPQLPTRACTTSTCSTTSPRHGRTRAANRSPIRPTCTPPRTRRPTGSGRRSTAG